MYTTFFQIAHAMMTLTLMPLEAVPAAAPVPAHKPATPLFWRPPLAQWPRILNEQEKLLASYKSCPSCHSQAVLDWQAFLQTLNGQPSLDQVISINNYLNARPYKQDSWLYMISDRWAGVEDFLTHSGDCEDFAIAKYFSLRQIGFNTQDLQIMLVYDVYSGTDHALLRVMVDGHPYFLDNRADLIDKAGFEKRYRPHIAFNETDVHMYNQPLMARSIRGDDARILPGNR